METLKIKLATLRKVDGNVRKHSEQQLKEYMRSVEAYGQLKPLVIDENGTILIGNGLYDALIGLGWTEADCYRVTGLTEKQKKKMIDMLSGSAILMAFCSLLFESNGFNGTILENAYRNIIAFTMGITLAVLALNILYLCGILDKIRAWKLKHFPEKKREG